MAAALLALAAATLVPLGLHMASVYSGDGVAACNAHTAASGAGCGGIVSDFLHRFEHAGPIIPWLNFLPGLFGVLFAAPLVLEFEHGTFRLAWTQSVTRRRWLTVKLLTILASGMVATFALTELMTWWREPLDQLQGRMEPNVFDFEGIVPYAYTLFALALVIALGVFTRRMIVSFAGGLLAFFTLRIGIQSFVREHYLSAVKVVWPPGTAGPRNVDRSWSLLSGPSDAHGHPLPSPNQVVPTCITAPKQQIEHCLRAHHVFNVAVYQPASRFWLFQGIEAGIFAGLAVALLLASAWWLKHRLA